MPNGKPNILILWGDYIGWFNISHNNRGMMGYQTPNIDKLIAQMNKAQDGSMH
jgi:arylsulfatase